MLAIGESPRPGEGWTGHPGKRFFPKKFGGVGELSPTSIEQRILDTYAGKQLSQAATDA
jgi:hypothetical protein